VINPIRCLAPIILLVAGCSAPESFDLEPEWLPLKHLVERPDMLAASTVVFTVGENAYVEDIDRWLAEHPVGSGVYRAILRHEQEHSSRQLDMGVYAWLARYMLDVGFMRDEELRGWYWQIKVLGQHGITIDPGGIARNLHHYWNAGGKMIGYDEALQWVQDVQAGNWHPPE